MNDAVSLVRSKQLLYRTTWATTPAVSVASPRKTANHRAKSLKSRSSPSKHSSTAAASAATRATGPASPARSHKRSSEKKRRAPSRPGPVVEAGGPPCRRCCFRSGTRFGENCRHEEDHQRRTLGRPCTWFGFRAVPTNEDALPRLAKETRPGAIEHVLLKVEGDVSTAEKWLYRRRLELRQRFRDAGVDVYISSLSAKLVSYKGC